MERRGVGSALKAFTLNDGVTTGLGHYVHSVIMAFDATNLSTPRLSVCEQMLALSYICKAVLKSACLINLPNIANGLLV